MESRRTREIEANRGVVKRGLLQTVRMIIFLGVAFWFTLWLFTNDYLNVNDFYRAGVPADIPPIGIQLAISLVMVMILQVLYFILFLWINPKGRRRTGRAHYEDDGSEQYQGWN